MPKVLISDNLSARAVEIFRERQIEVDFEPGIKGDELVTKIGDADGLAIRSATMVTAALLDAAKSLKVVGRAGIGIDNVDVDAATQRGVVVMNTPFGNSVTTAEHAIAMMMSLARQLPIANASTHAGKWEKSAFMGMELASKTLGLIGCGNIGSIVVDRAQGLKMRVVVYDPFLSPEKATGLGVEKVSFDDLLCRADVVTIHAPLTDSTRDLLDAVAFAKMKDGVRIVNCARGGIIVERDLRDAILSGKVAGAAIDVFAEEPAHENVLFGMPDVIATPHLGAATSEAQENVALQVAEQMSDYLLSGAVSNAINMPSMTAEEAPKLKPYMSLAEKLGSFAGQMTETGLQGATIEFQGHVATLNTRPLVSSAIAGLLRPQLDNINMVNAVGVARDRGIDIVETKQEQPGDYETMIRLTVRTERQERSVGGTIFGGDRERIVEIKGIPIEAELGRYMLYITNKDRPGVIGDLGKTLGDNGVNIATFHLGRWAPGDDAIALLQIDNVIDEPLLKDLENLPNIVQVKPLAF
ncbi:MAG: D-3-phosphoglycerate dehydrogenase [Alphaproteobacteria bacterium MarineAlpha4_Bin2]|nr:MAG: D-3-phosphoglycerate dehydrogenase [Alphaproteobacteria bacterium MarineAlpha4_Bin2]